MKQNDEAYKAIQRGFKIFPVAANDKKPPLIKDWNMNASSDKAQIDAWIEQFPDCNFGLAAGASFQIVVDIDPRNGGLETLRKLEAEFGPMPATLIAITPSGGFHYYYLGVCQSKTNALGPGVDIKSAGGYVVLAGSKRPDGEYKWANSTPIAGCPPWILYRVGAPLERTKHKEPAIDLDRPDSIERAKAYLEAFAKPSIEGQGGDNNAYKVACKLHNLGVTEVTAIELMLEHWNERCEPPWSVEELQIKVENAYRYARLQAGHLHPDVIFPAPLLQAVDPEQTEAPPDAQQSEALDLFAGSFDLAQEPICGVEPIRGAESEPVRPSAAEAQSFALQNAASNSAPGATPGAAPLDVAPGANIWTPEPRDNRIIVLQNKSVADIREADLEPRRWILGSRYLAGYSTVTISPGGVGKSLLLMLEMAAIALGIPLTGEPVHIQGPTLYHCTEDPLDEIERRCVAIAKAYSLDMSLFKDFHISSGVNNPLVYLTESGGEFVINEPLVKLTIETIKHYGIVAFAVDPFLRAHAVDENSNGAIDKVMQIFSRIEQETGVACALAHHTRKRSGPSSGAGDADSARGASSLVYACRIAQTLVPMTEKEAEAIGIAPDRADWFVRIDDAKKNLRPPGKETRWYEKISVKLDTGDYLGVLKVAEFTPKTVARKQNVQMLERIDKYYMDFVTVSELGKIMRTDGLEGSKNTVIKSIKDAIGDGAVFNGYIYSIEMLKNERSKPALTVVRRSIEEVPDEVG